MAIDLSVEGASGVRAEVDYIRNPPTASEETLEFVPHADARTTMRTLPGRPMWTRALRLKKWF